MDNHTSFGEGVMPESLVEKKEILTYILYIVVFLFVMSRAYGIANLLRFLFRHLNIGYSDRKMKSLDEKWFNVQLFKIINRINITKIEDARLIQKGLNEGFLKSSDFYFTSSWGDVTLPMSLPRKIRSFMMGLTLVILGSVAWYVQEPIIEGYAKFDFKEFSYYISKDKFFITNKYTKSSPPTIHSKEDCKNSLKLIDSTSIFAIACTKFLDESKSYQWWLADEIKSINKAKNSLSTLAYIYLTLGTIWLFSLLQHLTAGKKVRKYKASIENI
ncbi:hypothetical protein [Kosakonia pseudosacchari]|uniref:hypothetical protein n=1 Tax=Kosakonia pseudosacchari TaxID=1646340 RepID=UPI000A3B8FCD|nr:hypothetical protein [Kosakonia pseudosacchari]